MAGSSSTESTIISGITEICGQVIPGFELYVEWLLALQHLGQNLLAGLDQSLSPARLLRLERGHLYRKFGRAFDILQVNELPALQLRAIGEIGVFGERVVLPAAGFVDGAAAATFPRCR